MRGFIVTLFFACTAFAPAKLNAGDYVARLISPICWTGSLPRAESQGGVEGNASPYRLDGVRVEVWLSLDGGQSFLSCITPIPRPEG